MSVNLVNSDGSLSKVAGKIANGELIPSASYYQHGTASYANSITTENAARVNIALSNPMPDTDYVVTINILANAECKPDVRDKTVNGFVVQLVNLSSQTVTNTQFEWFAYKLMTDENRVLDETAIAQNTSDISDLKDDKQDKELETALSIGGENRATVESALSALVSEDFVTEIGTSQADIQSFLDTLVAKGNGYYKGGIALTNGVSATYICRINGNAGTALVMTLSGTHYVFRRVSGEWTRDTLVTNEIVPSNASASNQLVTYDMAMATKGDFQGNIDTVYKSGIYRCGGSISGTFPTDYDAATAGGGYLIVYQGKENFYMQELVAVNNARRWIRKTWGGSTYSGWTKVLTGSDLTSTVTSGSTAPITSGGVASALKKHRICIPWKSNDDTELVASSAGVTGSVALAWDTWLKSNISFGTAIRYRFILTGSCNSGTATIKFGSASADLATLSLTANSNATGFNRPYATSWISNEIGANIYMYKSTGSGKVTWSELSVEIEYAET